MLRRLTYVAALLVLLGAVIFWFKARPFKNAAVVVAPQSLAADAAMLTAAPGKWQSDVVKITVRDGTTQNRMLGIEFGAVEDAGPTNTPVAKAKLFTASPTEGIKGVAEASSSFGDGSFRDVRLRETNGVRTITITRAVDETDSNPARRQRINDRYFSISFRYELKDNVLTLKGFPTTNKVAWGVSEFIVSQEEIKFKVAPQQPR